MPALRTYSVFVCHDWEYSDDYGRICSFLTKASNFDWENLSVPEHDPFDTDDQPEYNLRNQIRPAHVMLVLAGMYSARSGWMDWEIEFARRIGTPIIGVRPWGNVQMPAVVRQSAREVVGWNTGTIVNAIRRHARRP